MPYANPEHKRWNSQLYYERNRAKIIARATAWNRANREKAAAHKKAWEEAHPDYSHQWYEENKERVLAQTKAAAKRRREENPERMKAMARNTVARRRARQREAFVEHVDPLLVWERDQGNCGICGEAADPSDWHLDHVMPIARGGEHSYANVQVAHPYCNRSKGSS